jgi:uncharacterized membrane protein YraQ (UPF0718 family)
MSIMLIFWTISRYPALLGKLATGTDIQVTGSITFGSALATEEGMSLVQRIFYTTINWVDANKKGMSFGVLFGGALLTLLNMLPLLKTKSRHMNAFIGMLTGAPLGVCANCVAPIGKGMYLSGTKMETVLATMFSSPSLNVVVVAMLFSLFPLHIVAVKLFLTFAFILLGIPLLVYLHGNTKEEPTVGNCKFSPKASAPNSTWYTAFRQTGALYLQNLWFIAWRTVPLMFVAGALGATLMEVIPSSLWSTPPTLPLLILISLAGTFLPVPIAFDVALSYTLYAAGAPTVIVVTLLFTLGIYSVYSGIIVATTISKKMAGVLYATVAATGLLAAWVVTLLEKGLANPTVGQSIASTSCIMLLAVVCTLYQQRLQRVESV